MLTPWNFDINNGFIFHTKKPRPERKRKILSVKHMRCATGLESRPFWLPSPDSALLILNTVLSPYLMIWQRYFIRFFHACIHTDKQTHQIYMHIHISNSWSRKKRVSNFWTKSIEHMLALEFAAPLPNILHLALQMKDSSAWIQLPFENWPKHNPRAYQILSGSLLLWALLCDVRKQGILGEC